MLHTRTVFQLGLASDSGWICFWTTWHRPPQDARIWWCCSSPACDQSCGLNNMGQLKHTISMPGLCRLAPSDNNTYQQNNQLQLSQVFQLQTPNYGLTCHLASIMLATSAADVCSFSSTFRGQNKIFAEKNSISSQNVCMCGGEFFLLQGNIKQK